MRIARLPKASVSIHVNGSALYEHMAESEHQMIAISYVEAVSSAEFAVVLKLEPRFTLRDKLQVLVCAISLDGEEVKRHLFREAHMGHGITDCIDSAPDDVDGVTCSRKFTFAQHASTEGKPDPRLVQRLSKIGEISVTLWRGRETGIPPRQIEHKFKALGEKGIPEKALKGRAVSNHAALGRVDHNAPVVQYSNYVDCEERPMAVYKFRYRSRRDLDIEGIIKSRPLLPLEQQDPEDLTPEEARELVRRMRAAKEKDAPANIKPEVRPKPEKSGKRQHSEVIDLLSDEDEDEGVSIISIANTKRVKTAGSSSLEVLDLTGE